MQTVKKIIIPLIIVFVLLIGLNSCLYTIEPDDIAVVSRFGKITKVIVRSDYADIVKESMVGNDTLTDVTVIGRRGLFMKVPVIDSVERMTSKYLTYTSTKETINTIDKRKLDIQMFAQYRIVNPALYKIKVATGSKLNQLMDDNVYPIVIQSANKLNFNEFFDNEIMTTIIEDRISQLNGSLINQYGIEIIDIGIHRKKFPTSTIDSIADKMCKEIQKESEQLIAEGDAIYTETTAQTDLEQKTILAKATEESAIIRAEAEKKALIIYQNSLQKDLEFYRFIQRMNAYKNLKGETIFMDKDNDFLSYIGGY